MNDILMNNSPSNIMQPLILFERYHQKCQAVLAAIGMNGLNLTRTIKME